MRALWILIGFVVAAAIGFAGGWFLARERLPFQKPAVEALKVIDGDTVKIGTQLLRIENLDAPETTRRRAKCEKEIALGEQATKALDKMIADALMDGKVAIFPNGTLDKYRRPLVRVEVNGEDVSKEMIGKGLARPWQGKTSDWCTAP